MVVLGASRFLAVAVTVFVLWRIVCWRRSGVDLLREAVVALLFGWSLIVAYVTFFPMIIVFYDWHGSSSLVPFASTIDLLLHANGRTALTNIAGNVLLFVPFGLLLPLLFKTLRVAWALAWRVAVIAAAIEIAQIPTRVRATDVDDIILNVSGALLGLVLFRILCRLARRAPRLAATVERLGSGKRREPLLIGAVPVGIIATLTVVVLAPTVLSNTMSEQDLLRDATSDPPHGSVVARSSAGGFEFIVAGWGTRGSKKLRYSEYKRVLPGRYTWTAKGDMVKEQGSGYAQAVTISNTDRREKPVIAVWGRNDAGATTLFIRAQGQSPDRAVAIGEYFLVAFAYDERANVADDGLLDGLRYRFVDGAGRDVTPQFAKW